MHRNDHLKLGNGTLLKGYVKRVRDINEGQPLLANKNRDPVRYDRSDVEEFTMSGSVFHTLEQFSAFLQPRIFLHVQAEIREAGSVELLRATNPYYGNYFVPAFCNSVCRSLIFSRQTETALGSTVSG